MATIGITIKRPVKYNAVPSEETPLDKSPNEHVLGLYDIPMNI
jgi:hypothetical protein